MPGETNQHVLQNRIEGQKADVERFSHPYNHHALTSKADLIIALLSPGRLRGPPGVFRGEWEMVPGRHRELGRGLCSSEQAGCLHTRHQAGRLDQEGDRDLMRSVGSETGHRMGNNIKVLKIMETEL